MFSVDTRALFMKEVDQAAEDNDSVGHSQHHHQEHSAKDLDLALPKKPTQERQDEMQCACVRCEIVCGHRRVYLLENCRHCLCLLCLYSHMSESLKELLEKEGTTTKHEEDQGLAPIRSFYTFKCPQEGCQSSLSKLDLKVGTLLFDQMDLDFPSLSESLNEESVEGVDFDRWKGVRIVDLKKTALNSSPNQTLFPITLTSSIETMIEQYEEFVRCPNDQCKAVFERVWHEEEPQGTVSDDSGRPLKYEALQDYHHNRFRCRRCSVVFCANCKANPYHLGRTCEDNRIGKGKRKECRFCLQSLPREHRSYQALNGLIDLMKELEPPNKNQRIDDWKIDRNVLDELFPLDQPGLSDEQKAELEEQRMLYQALMVEEQEPISPEASDTVISIRLEGVYRLGTQPPNDLKINVLVGFKDDGTLTLHTGPFCIERDNVATLSKDGGDVQEFPVTKVISLKTNETFDMQLFAGDYRFDGNLEFLYLPTVGRLDPIFANWKGYFVRTNNLKYAGTFCLSASFEPPSVEGPEYFVCPEEECAQKMEQSCKKTHPCGHICRGIVDESMCLPCIEEECPCFGIIFGGQSSSSYSPMVLQNSGFDYCGICHIDEIAAAPSVMLHCGHAFHYECVTRRLKDDGSPGRISFAAMECPTCTKPIKHPAPAIAERVNYFTVLKKAVDDLALRHLKLEGLDKDPKITTPGSEYYNKPLEFAYKTYDFFICANCSGAMYGGHHICAAEGENDVGGNPAPGGAVAGGAAAGGAAAGGAAAGGAAEGAPEAKRLCPSCRSMLSVNGCRFHGGDRTIFKCRFCCAVATYFCGGMCHYCDPCHGKAGELTDFNGWKTKDASKLPKCLGPEKCPIGMPHPPNGQEFPIGCSVCRERGIMGLSSKTFFPLGFWFTKLAGHNCGESSNGFPPLFGSGVGFEKSKGPFKAACLWNGEALKMDRNSGSYVQIKDIPFPKDFKGKKFGISCNVYLTKADVGGPLISVADSFEFRVEKANLRYKNHRDKSASKSYSFPLDKWTRVMLLVDETEILFATDVKYIGESNTLGLPKWKKHAIASVGRGLSDGPSFSGCLKELSLWFGDGDFSSYELFYDNFPHLLGQDKIASKEEEEGKKKEEEEGGSGRKKEKEKEKEGKEKGKKRRKK
eukprot:CAMPEP_0201478736 /NCGR_PEP_ID=MMETSP0151_2-20130828/3510_1 /ASSEMBLY_ACC=CAM_ASM_000257 /TAXON_ID=200890 /ORGANISM="Paramoeba atlantica, Strain 621/1 / CCAP 1560/9" /LENGTH=1139 /DNA_ID=CAMNT_0047859915 /DNA_START=83 /DNA_END=3502 /DNA_ORIENTATION=-